MYYYICQLIAAAVGIKTRTDSRISHHSCHITYTSQSDVRYFPRFYILTFDAVSLCVPKFLCDSSVTTELYQHSVNYNQFHNSYNSSLLLAIVHREQHAKWPFCHTRFFYLNSYCVNLLVLFDYSSDIYNILSHTPVFVLPLLLKYPRCVRYSCIFKTNKNRYLI